MRWLLCVIAVVTVVCPPLVAQDVGPNQGLRWHFPLANDARAADDDAKHASATESRMENCEVPVEHTFDESGNSWSEAETWVWREVCRGRKANLIQRIVMLQGVDTDLRSKARVRAERRISARFLETVLLRESFRKATPQQGIRVSGAYFDEEIDLREAFIDRPLLLEQSEFKSKLKMRRFAATRSVSLARSKFFAPLELNSASFGEDLDLSQTIVKSLEVSDAEIGGHVNLDGSKFIDALTMYSTSIGGKLSMWAVKSASAMLHRVKVGDTLDMRGSTFFDILDLTSSEVMGDVTMGETTPTTSFKHVLMSGAKIGGNLDLRSSKFQGLLTMDSISVGDDVLMGGAQVGGIASMVSHRIGGNLELHGATLGKLNLAGGRIEGLLSLGSYKKHVEWTENAKLTLRNLTVGAVQDVEESWPDTHGQLDLELDGFRYGHFVGSSEMERFGWHSSVDEHEDPYRRSSDWFIRWLKNDATYSPQPYLHLASVLRAAGYEDKADDVLFENREVQRGRPETSWGRWLFLSGLKVTIGYGYGWRYFWVLGWTALFALIGTVVLRVRGEMLNDEKLGFLYSLDMLLPVIHLRESHYDVDLRGEWTRRYFAIHKVAGYVLTFFVVAGLADLAG